MEDLQNLREKILAYQLEGSFFGDLGYTRILLQLCGSAGHGKSSLINSFKYALHGGHFSISAPVAPAIESQGGFTTGRLPYELTEVITLVDNRGFGKSDSFEKEEVYAQLANIQPLNEEVNWDWSFENRIEAVMTARHNTNDLLVPIFVHSVTDQIPENKKTEMIKFFKTAQNITGFHPIIVLTKKLSGDVKKMRLQFEQMDAENIFEVENYTKDYHVKTPGKDRTFLTILSTVLDLVDFVAKNVMPDMGTPEEEHKKRVKTLLKMAHENGIQREKDKLVKETPPPKKESKCPLL